MLKIKNVSKHFEGVKAVDKCSFEVEKGTITALIGPNGAGKTTLFNIITGFIKPCSGKIRFNGEDITGISPEKRFMMGISRTFQIIRLFPKLTVLENMLLAMPNHDGALHSLFPVKNSFEKNNREKAVELLEFVGIHAKLNEKAMNLSFGQQKLLEIAKALAQDSDLIMLDEPASGVNLTMLAKIRGLLLKLKKQGKTILFIEHNMDFVMDIADKIVVLDYGKKIAEGTPKQIQGNKKVIDAYLGVAE
jgi:ABC-type branched-subunit amino acid transport system ATPase component